MKRQNSFLSTSSSQQGEISSDNLLLLRRSRRRSKSFGCISSLLHFLSNNNHSRRNKSITFVHNSNRQLDDAISESKASQSPNPASAANLLISSSISPQIIIAEPSDSSISTTATSERFRGARGPIVRLMGLEISMGEEGVLGAATEKQRQVMEALEKCEQDLKALKKFIDTFESTESFRFSSPVSVLEELSRPRHFLNRHGCDNSMLFQRPSAYSGRIIESQEMQRKKPDGDMFNNVSKVERGKIHEEECAEVCKSGKAMRESVEGVCKDIVWGQEREVGRIGLALQHQICGDLIEELVKDLNLFGYTYTSTYTSRPFQACNRRLCF